MNQFEFLAAQLDWAYRNICNNLEFVPDDKLDWKPEPTAKSVLEIINHAATPLLGISSALATGSWEADFIPATNREEAKVLITQAAESCLAVLSDMTEADTQGTVKLPYVEVPRAFAAQMPVLDLIHHHGQIAYLQTLWGDNENHLLM